MPEIELGNVILDLQDEGNDIRVKGNATSVLLENQTIASVSQIILENFKKVNDFYIKKVQEDVNEFNFKDINQISTLVVLHYLCMYNTWRNKYKRKKYEDLAFKESDFKNLTTADLIINFYRKKYPETWEHKCKILLGMATIEFDKFYQERLRFYNM